MTPLVPQVPFDRPDDVLEDSTQKDHDAITPAMEKPSPIDSLPNKEMRGRILAYYGRKAEEDEIAPAADVTLILDRILEMTDDEALDIVVDAMDFHKIDPNFPPWTMAKLRVLVQGYKAAEMSEADWSFDIKTEAAMIRYHSPYPEVRSVTLPYDDPSIPVETIRAYILGLCFMAGSTALNTFFKPRQPAISISAIVLQLLLAPCGMFCAKVLPDWGFRFRGNRVSLNPGPWSFKEQVFSTVMFTVAGSAGGSYWTFLVQLIPQYLDQKWLTFGYEILFSLCVQGMGFGFSGMLRRFVIFPVNAIWPSVLPALALNRALVVPEKKGEVINGWTYTRYRFFLMCFGAMFVYFWIPNTFFTALHGFNWMTWIAPDNFNLGMITGFYGGMGFNPWATFDWNVAGTNSLVTPFFSTVQQYIGRVLSGLIIIGMYWSNYIWSAYTPINSNLAFNNKGVQYNSSAIMGPDNRVDIEKYKEYGPPYLSGANVFGQGAWYTWYTLSLFYVAIRHWAVIKTSFSRMFKALRTRTSVYHGNNDPHSLMMAKYKEVPDWWYLVQLLVCFAFGMIAIQVWPTQTPWWALVAVLVLNFIFLVPAAIMVSYANLHLNTGLLFLMFAGLWFSGNPQAVIVSQTVATVFNGQTDSFAADLKLGHYAKIPPRAMFRAQVLATILNQFIWVALMNWMLNNFERDSFCRWDNPDHFTCPNAGATFSLIVEYGAFGVRNMFKLYPFLPWVFLIAPLVGILWALAQNVAPSWREKARVSWAPERYAIVDRYVFRPLSWINWIDPSVMWAGSLNWTGGVNLSYATNAVYLSFIFMYYLRRHYSAWWQKYNYLVEAGFEVGVALSGLLQTLIFAFGGLKFPKWWGNTVATAGVDYQSYIQNSTLLPIPDVGYFGLAPDQYPMDF